MQLCQNLLLFGELAGGVFRVDQAAVDGDIEDPPTPFNQGWLHTGCLLDRGRQTGGSWCVISLHAVLDRYLHPANLQPLIGQLLNCTEIGSLLPPTRIIHAELHDRLEKYTWAALQKIVNGL